MSALRLSRSAHKALDSLPPKQYRQVVRRILELLRDAEPHDAGPLKGSDVGHMRLDAGEYRIVYRLEDDVIWIDVVGKRNDDAVYREVARKP